MKRQIKYKISALLSVAAIFSLGIMIGEVSAQTNPIPQTLPYTQDFGTSSFSALPAGFAGWNGISGASVNSQANAEATVPTGNATITATTAVQTTAGIYGYSPAATDASVYIQTSGNPTNGVNQLALGLDTTTCVAPSQVVVSYVVSSVSVQPRTFGVVAQYRIGTSGTWTTITTTGNPFSFNSAGGGGPFAATPTLLLPVSANGQPNVQIRWAIWRGNESGNSSGGSIDSINSRCSVVTAANSSISGRVLAGKTGISRAMVMLSGGSLEEPIYTTTNSFGFYNFSELPVGESYVVTVSSRKHSFTNPSLVISLNENVSDADFIAEER